MELPQFDHTPYYCEENIYNLCKKLSSSGIADAQASHLFVVFISNHNKQIPLWHQKASHRADGVILWDYHVICVQIKGSGDAPQVWDLDSTLAFPSPLPSYVAQTFQPSFQLFPEYQRFYRIVHAPIFLRSFASDRRHMKDPNGEWTAQPPSYDPIIAQDGTIHNLNEYMEIHSGDAVPKLEAKVVNAVSEERLGVVVNENQLQQFFAHASSVTPHS
ncbi:protein N-terminal glutamine amidohydrolase [Silene latifolia]|uniref:protein N-terminal glutamine amidohydrolase n=1 Tax=Silene latifolia TaxID=37657 RepID=UPI003D76F6A5